MELLLSLILFSATVLIRLQILTLILFGIILYHAVKRDWKTMGRTVLSYLLAVALIVGIPSGVAKSMIPEAEGHEQMIMKEVQEWIS